MCFFPSADCVLQSFRTGEGLPHQNCEGSASLQPLCPVSEWADINGLQCQEWRMVLSHLGAQSSLGRHEPPPALGFAGCGYVCMRLGTQEHIFPTRVAFNYTTASLAEAGILAKGFSFSQLFSQFVHLPLSWTIPKTPKSNRICNDETEVAGVRKGEGEWQTHFSIRRFSLIKGCWL